MLEIIDVMDSVLIEQGHLPIRVIYGELRPYDPPYDQYEKSIPFYMKQAELHNLSIQFYEEDEATFQKRDISFDEALSFIDHWKCGGFRYSFTISDTERMAFEKFLSQCLFRKQGRDDE